MIIDFENLVISNAGDSSNSDIKISVAGDWAPVSGNTSKILIDQKENYYKELNHIFEDSDINIVNLETVIGTKEGKHSNKFGRSFIDSEETLQTLLHSHINLACLANNHIMDYGKEGLESTISALNKININHIGAANSIQKIYKPFLIEKNNTKVAIINVADGEMCNEKYNNGIGAADIESYKVFDTIREYKSQGYIIMLIVHAGIEFLPVPAPYIQKIYRNFVDEGVDILIGHHPHVVQGVEIYNNKPIIYSIGHFSIFRKDSRDQEKIGIIPKIYINSQKVIKIEIVPIKLQKNKLILLKDKKAFIEELKKLSEYIVNPNKLSAIWKAYTHHRNMILNFREIVNLYKINAIKSKYMMSSMASTLNLRYMLLTHQESDVKIEECYNDLLKKYKLIKKKSIMQNIFLRQKNMFYPVFYIRQKLLYFLKYIKGIIIK